MILTTTGGNLMTKREIFQKYFDRAKEERDDFIESLNLTKEQTLKLIKVCELYFTAGQNNNF
jgi:hypothetical protein